MKIFDAGLTPDRENANEGTQRGLGLLEKSLRKLGGGRSILADKHGNIIAGNKTLQSAADIDLPVRIIETDGTELVVVKRTDLDLYSETDKRARKLAYADNKISEIDLAWKPEQIEADFEPLELGEWGFIDPNPPVADAEPQIDRAAELNEKWQVKTGDLWQIGEHRLLCGDSTVKAHVDRVMQSDKMDLLFTSPPYGQQRDYTDDTKEKVKDWDGLMNGVFSYIPGNDDIQIIVNLGLIHEDNEWQPYYDNWIAWMRGNGWRRLGLYVWDQGFGLMGDWNGRLAPSFEFIFHFNKISKQPNKIIEKHADSIKIKKGEGLRKKDGSIGKLTNPEASLQTHKIPDSVVRIFRSSEAIRQLHPAVFSLSFAEFNIETWSNKGDISYEPFCGSGTTMVACENLSRKCRAIEISPNYCSVILQRMSDAFPGIEIQRMERT